MITNEQARQVFAGRLENLLKCDECIKQTCFTTGFEVDASMGNIEKVSLFVKVIVIYQTDVDRYLVMGAFL